MNKHERGFTLVEVVISLALGGLILTAIMSLFVSFVQVWQVKKTPYETFIEHVDNCTRFLCNRLNAFECSIGNPSSEPDKQNRTEQPLLGFHCTRLTANNTVLNGPWVLGMMSYKSLPFFHIEPSQRSSIVYEVALALTSNGLCLILESPEIVKQHLGDGIEHTDKTVKKHFILSPYVTSIEYAHFNPDKGLWEFVSSLEQYCKRFAGKDFCQRPDGLRLKFKQEDFEAERFIFLHNDFCEATEKDSKKAQKLREKKEQHDPRK